LAAAMGQILPGIINRHEGSNRVMEWYLRNYYQKSAFRKGVFCYVRLSGGALSFHRSIRPRCYLLSFDLGAIARTRGNRLTSPRWYPPTLRRNRHVLLPTGSVIRVPDPQQPSQLINQVASFP